MNTLDSLTLVVAPIDAPTAEAVTGGIIPIIAMFVAGFGAGFGGAALVDLATGS